MRCQDPDPRNYGLLENSGHQCVLFLSSPGDSSVEPGLKITALVVQTSVVEPNSLSLNAGSYSLDTLGQFTQTLMFGFSACKIGIITESFPKILGRIK